MTTQKNETGLVINIPFQLKNQIDSIFSDSTKNQIDKVLFIVYKICKEKKYQINIKNHADMLGVKTGILTSILTKLKNNDIIKSAGDYRIGAVSNSYTLIQNYNCEDENNYKLFFYPSKTKVPTWVQQYITDGYSVVAKEFSKFRNQLNNKVELTYEEQAKLIIQLRAELASLKASIDSDDKEVVKDIIIDSKPAIVAEPVESNDDNDIFEYNLKTKTYYFQNYSIIKNIAVDEDDEAIIMNQLMAKKDDGGQIIYNNKIIEYSKAQVENEIMILLVA